MTTAWTASPKVANPAPPMLMKSAAAAEKAMAAAARKGARREPCRSGRVSAYMSGALKCARYALDASERKKATLLALGAT